MALQHFGKQLLTFQRFGYNVMLHTYFKRVRCTTTHFPNRHRPFLNLLPLCARHSNMQPSCTCFPTAWIMITLMLVQFKQTFRPPRPQRTTCSTGRALLLNNWTRLLVVARTVNRKRWPPGSTLGTFLMAREGIMIARRVTYKSTIGTFTKAGNVGSNDFITSYQRWILCTFLWVAICCFPKTFARHHTLTLLFAGECRMVAGGQHTFGTVAAFTKARTFRGYGLVAV